MKKKPKKTISVAAHDDGTPLTTADVLRNIRKDIAEMETHSVDGSLVLVVKADVLEIVQDWLEYILNPDE